MSAARIAVIAVASAVAILLGATASGLFSPDGTAGAAAEPHAHQHPAAALQPTPTATTVPPPAAEEPGHAHAAMAGSDRPVLRSGQPTAPPPTAAPVETGHAAH